MNTTMNKTILLLISDPVVRSVIREALEHGGYYVVAAGDLGEAVDRLKESTPDLLMIRSYVESISGYDAATFLRTKCPGLRILMVGGLIDDDRLRYRMTLEEIEVFPKPFTVGALLEKVKDVLHGAG
jgi:two-component system phosphate regulon response regulator PhoB